MRTLFPTLPAPSAPLEADTSANALLEADPSTALTSTELSQGWEAFDARQFQSAADCFVKASRIYRSGNDPRNAGIAMGLASVAWKRGGERVKEAGAWEKGIRMMGEAVPHPLFDLFRGVGLNCMRQKKLGIAGNIFEKGGCQLKREGDTQGAGTLFYLLGVVLIRSQSPIDAYIAFLKSDMLMRLAEDSEETDAMREAVKLKGDSTLEFLNATAKRLRKTGERILEAGVRLEMAELFLRSGRASEGLEEFLWLARFFGRGNRKKSADFYFAAGRLCEELEKNAEAEEVYGRAFYFYSSGGYRSEAKKALLARAEVLKRMTRFEDAERLLDRLGEW